jgi:predicted metal-binding membrane protein
MAGMSDMAMPTAVASWNWSDVALKLVIWWAMIPGMMQPSTAPMIPTFATINR